MQRLPPLESSNLLLDVLTGNNTKLPIEEVLGSELYVCASVLSVCLSDISLMTFWIVSNHHIGSSDGRLPVDIHSAIDKKLNFD